MPVPLEQIPYDDYPEIQINEHERTEMPFRYVKGADGKSIMPPVCDCPGIALYWYILTHIGNGRPDQAGRRQGG